ncbi:FGGY-family carbohydrate kinase [Archaeoglobus sulfaticallidus]|uniref:FGGY-family carbohydrate kinase n=1 Tax=Archaeoglobus sulfaticallidus TaxID=1316941 RepID=UPI00064F112E|nr:FGGY-family carbohydrate kinase [Archaeoglobus sulfaticallidus]
MALFDVWCQIIADVINKPVRRMKSPDQVGLRGLAAMALVSLGKSKNFDDAISKSEVDQVLKPENAGRYMRSYARPFKEYVNAYKKLKKVYMALNW